MLPTSWRLDCMRHEQLAGAVLEGTVNPLGRVAFNAYQDFAYFVWYVVVDQEALANGLTR
jgi:hypothetical protein